MQEKVEIIPNHIVHFWTILDNIGQKYSKNGYCELGIILENKVLQKLKLEKMFLLKNGLLQL